MKKYINITFLLMSLLLALTACGKKTAKIEETTQVQVQETEPTKVDSSINKNTDSKEEKKETETIPASDSNGNHIYYNKSKTNIQTQNAPITEKGFIDLSNWHYGMTPIEWVYIEPNTQIISNTKPNGSLNFSYKSKASSGEKGCFLTVFSKCEQYGADYDGRFYCIEDYTKTEPEDMLWKNAFNTLTYNGQNVLDILSKKYDIQKMTKNIYFVGDTYVNVIYCDELEEIMAENP